MAKDSSFKLQDLALMLIGEAILFLR